MNTVTPPEFAALVVPVVPLLPSVEPAVRLATLLFRLIVVLPLRAVTRFEPTIPELPIETGDVLVPVLMLVAALLLTLMFVRPVIRFSVVAVMKLDGAATVLLTVALTLFVAAWMVLEVAAVIVLAPVDVMLLAAPLIELTPLLAWIVLAPE